MKATKLFCVTAVLLSLAVLSSLFSGCSPQRRELSLEEAHRLCEQYDDDTCWASISYNGAPYHYSLDRLVEYYLKRGDLNLCSCEITKAEVMRAAEDSETGEAGIQLTLKINEIYIGDPSAKGREKVQYALQKSEDVSHLLGNRYLLFVEGISIQYEDGNLIPFYPWSFLIAEDDILVSPYGCQLEESQIGEDGLSMECRDYTGQTLSYFISKVRELQAKVREES